MALLAPVARLFFLVAICCSAAFADTEPSQVSTALDIGQDSRRAQPGPEGRTENLAERRVAGLPLDSTAAERQVLQPARRDVVPGEPAPERAEGSAQQELASLPADPVDNEQAVVRSSREDGPLAHPESDREPGSLAQPQLGGLAPDRASGDADASQLPEPFDLPASTASTGEMTAKWNELQSRILADLKTIAG